MILGDERMKRFFKKFEQAFWFIWIVSSIFFGIVAVYLLELPANALTFIVMAAFFAVLPLGFRVFFLEAGIQLRSMEKYERALRRFKFFLGFYSKEEPRYHEIQLEIADTYLRMNEIELAEKHFDLIDAERELVSKKRPKYCRLLGMISLKKNVRIEEARDAFVMSLEEMKELLPYVMYQYLDICLGKKLNAKEFEDAVARKFTIFKEKDFLDIVKEPILKKARNGFGGKVRKLLPTDNYEWEMLKFYLTKVYELSNDFEKSEVIRKSKKSSIKFVEVK